MDSNKLIMYGGGAALLLVLLLLFRGKGGGTDVAVVRSVPTGGTNNDSEKLGLFAQIWQSLLGYQLSQDKLKSDERIAGLALEAQKGRDTFIIQAQDQQAAQQASAQQQAYNAYLAQLQQQADIAKAQASAQKTSSIWQGIGSLGSSIIGSIFGGGNSGGFGGFRTPPFFSSGIDWQDFGSIPSNDPYNREIVRYVDPLQAIRDREQNAIVPLATIPDINLGIFDRTNGGQPLTSGFNLGGGGGGWWDDWFGKSGGLWGAGGYFES